MSWRDRDYNRESSGSGGGGDIGSSLRRVFDWSFSIGTYLGVHVRIHFMFVLFAVFEFINQRGLSYPWWTLRWQALLFFSVLLHEFGHVLACRGVGGRANEILMWPLGGLAFCEPPRRPWPQFVTVACGPLVNFAIAAGCFVAFLLRDPAKMPVSLNPFRPWTIDYPAGAWGLAADAFVVNYILMCFNLAMVFYPFDGGRLVQIGLWKRLGYFRSMVIATRVGMSGAVVIGVVAIGAQNLTLALIAFFGFWACYQQAAALPMERELGGYGGIGGGDASSEPHEPSIGWYQRWRARRTSRRRAAQRQAAIDLELEVDRILVKVKDHGLHSLTEKEKKTLQRATTEKQKRV